MQIKEFSGRDEWLAARRQCVGASDSPAILGQSEWATPLSVYCDKLGIVPDREESERLEWGLRLEPIIADAFGHKTGRLVRRPGLSICLADATPHIGCSLDAMQTDVDKGDGVCEIKTTSEYNAEDWAEGVPLGYQIQLQHQLYVTGLRWGTVVCLIGGQRLVWRDIDRNENFITSLVVRLTEFWNLVRAGTPPNVTAAEVDKKILNALYPADSGEEIVLPNEFAALDAEREEVAAEIKRLEDRKTEIENLVKSEMKGATFGIVPGGAHRYKWSTVERKGYTVEPSSSRQLRRVRNVK